MSTTTTEYYLVRDYHERVEPRALPTADLLAELHDLVDEVPELSRLVSGSSGPQTEALPVPEESVALQRQLKLAWRRARAMWDEFNNRFGQPA